MVTEAQFPFLAEKGAMSSRWWAAGEMTTLLYALSEHCARRGWRVLAGTTTHIRQPERNFAAADADVKALWVAGAFAVLGTPDGSGKLTAPPPRQLEHWMEQADAVFLEADGAKRLPCKAPAAHEPVILPESDIVLAVAGLSAVEKAAGNRLLPAGNRLCAAGRGTGDPADAGTAGTASGQRGRGHASRWGQRQFYAVLNQADDAARRALGEETQKLLWERFRVRSVLTRFSEGERA